MIGGTEANAEDSKAREGDTFRGTSTLSTGKGELNFRYQLTFLYTVLASTNRFVVSTCKNGPNLCAQMGISAVRISYIGGWIFAAPNLQKAEMNFVIWKR